MKKKIEYKELSTALKIAVIGGWIMVSYFIGAFIIGLASVLVG